MSVSQKRTKNDILAAVLLFASVCDPRKDTAGLKALQAETKGLQKEDVAFNAPGGGAALLARLASHKHRAPDPRRWQKK